MALTGNGEFVLRHSTAFRSTYSRGIHVGGRKDDRNARALVMIVRTGT